LIKLQKKIENEHPPKGGILWVNRKDSPFREVSENAEIILKKTNLVVMVTETAGIEGPIFEYKGGEYRGIEEIKLLIKSTKITLE
jgi:hypothetical protein